MSCPLCASVPDSHSFVPFGSVGNNALFYTSPARAKDIKESQEKIVNFKKHLDTAKGPWIWVFDCGGMTMKHCNSMNFMLALAKILAAEHEDKLQKMIVLRPNTWIKTTLKLLKGMIKTGLLGKIKLVEGGSVELYMGLEGHIMGKPLQWLGTTLMLKPEEALPPTQS